MNYFIIAGEASGDMHAADLIHHLRRLDTNAHITGLGGDLMQQQGAHIIVHYRQMAFMGIWNVVRHHKDITHNFRTTQHALLHNKPDALLLIDYPSFNLRIAKWAKHHLPHTRTIYYISPKLWAWKSWRIRSIRRYIDDMYTIFPFETNYYAQRHYHVNYVGNPLIDHINQHPDLQQSRTDFCHHNGLDPDRPIIALLPGSRTQEITRCLPRMIQAAETTGHNYQIAISTAPGQDTHTYTRAGANTHTLINGHTYALLKHAQAAIVNSGTATLETALIGTPQVVVYNPILPHLASLVKPLVIKTQHVSLVNIIAGQQVVKELIGAHFTTHNTATELNRLLTDTHYTDTMRHHYTHLTHTLTTQHGAAATAATAIINSLNNTNTTPHLAHP